MKTLEIQVGRAQAHKTRIWWAVPNAIKLGAVAYGGKAVIRAASPLLSTRGTPSGDARSDAGVPANATLTLTQRLRRSRMSETLLQGCLTAHSLWLPYIT